MTKVVKIKGEGRRKQGSKCRLKRKQKKYENENCILILTNQLAGEIQISVVEIKIHQGKCNALAKISFSGSNTSFVSRQCEITALDLWGRRTCTSSSQLTAQPSTVRSLGHTLLCFSYHSKLHYLILLRLQILSFHLLALTISSI